MNQHSFCKLLNRSYIGPAKPKHIHKSTKLHKLGVVPTIDCCELIRKREGGSIAQW